MDRAALVEQIRSKRSYLCVGLDTDIRKIPAHLLVEPDPVFAFNKAIIDVTRDLCVSYKINTAFYEAFGVKGWETLEKTVRYIGESHFTIADAKRGDIGNTSTQYARAFFEALPFDAVTVAPYMGEDSVRPFLEYPGKWAIVLGLTSNQGAADFELRRVINREDLLTDEVHVTRQHTACLYEMVLERVAGWGQPGNLMFVVGATRAEEFVNIRRIVPSHFFLVPGVGAQGGSLKEISEKAMIADCGLLVNVSRGIIYAGNGTDFADRARAAAREYQTEMDSYLSSL